MISPLGAKAESSPQAVIRVHSKNTYKTRVALYPHSYPNVTAEGLGLNHTTSNHLDARMNALISCLTSAIKIPAFTLWRSG